MQTICCFLALFAVSLVTAQTTSSCQDIDTSACQIMAAQRPDLCSDPSLAKAACPRFCKLCPIECYHCNATILDYHLCNTTMACSDGQVCMRKELKSFVDGHHEYQMTCEEKQLCDGGSDLSIPFGKRNLASRDISITCCADDFCNYPGSIASTTTATTTSGGCPKDIIFLVDEASVVAKSHQAAIISLIMDVAKRLDIGMKDNLIALSGFADNIDVKFDLDRYTDKTRLLSHLQSQTFFTHDRRSDLHDAINALVNHILTPREGDRASYPNAVVFISDSYTSHEVHMSSRDPLQLHHASHDIIHVSVGPPTSFTSPLADNKVDSLVTDRNHILQVKDLYTTQNLVDSLVNLLLEC